MEAKKKKQLLEGTQKVGNLYFLQLFPHQPPAAEYKSEVGPSAHQVRKHKEEHGVPSVGGHVLKMTAGYKRKGGGLSKMEGVDVKG